MIDFEWPPVYTVKRHPRAKHVKLKTSPKKGLELIVPPRFNLKHVPKILSENKTWIEKQLLKLAEEEAKNKLDILPDKVVLHAIKQTWHIQYFAMQTPLRIIARPHQDIAVIGKIENKALCIKLLIKWLKQLAKIHLTHQLNLISKTLKLPYKNLTIRDQETRWGSCTKDKNISLNYKILFLPEPLANHILIHELCHTVHLNHSARFWKCVEKFDPDYQAHRIAVRKIDQWMPAWIA